MLFISCNATRPDGRGLAVEAGWFDSTANKLGAVYINPLTYNCYNDSAWSNAKDEENQFKLLKFQLQGVSAVDAATALSKLAGNQLYVESFFCAAQIERLFRDGGYRIPFSTPCVFSNFTESQRHRYQAIRKNTKQYDKACYRARMISACYKAVIDSDSLFNEFTTVH